MKRVNAYKLARLDGFDFYTGKTINYRENLGKTVLCPNPNSKMGVCTSGVIHASKNPNDCFVGASIPCSAYRVSGVPRCGDAKKWGFIKLDILEELVDLNALFGWNYTEAVNPINPLRQKVKPTQSDIQLLREWASVRASIWASIRASIWDSVRDSVRDSIWASIRASTRASVRASVWDSVRASIWDSVRDSIWAYIGSLFPNIEKWKYITHREGEYPYQAAADLWRRGLVPSVNGMIWRLHSGKRADIVFELNLTEDK